MRRNLTAYFGVCIIIGAVVGLLYGWFAQPFGQKVQQSRQSEYFFERTAQLLEGEMQISSGSKESFQGRRIVIASPDEPSAVIELDPEGHRFSGVFTFEMPDGANQGAGQWWVGYLHLTIHFAEGLKAGTVNLSAATNGFTFLKHKFESHRFSGVEINGMGMLGGEERLKTRENQVSLKEYNYLQRSGVKPGPTVFGIHLTGDAGIIERVVIENDSGVIQVPYPVARLVIEVEDANGEGADVGVPVTLPLSISSNGWSVEDVELSARVSKGEVGVSFEVGSFDVITTSKVATFVTVTPHSEGDIRIELSGRGDYAYGDTWLEMKTN